MAKRPDPDANTAHTAAKPPGSLGYKALASVGATMGALIARKALTSGWRTATGKEPPTAENPDVGWTEAATWAVASAVVVALAKLAAQRRIAANWRAASGE